MFTAIDRDDLVALQRVDTTPAAQRSESRPPALGESHGGVTVRNYFAKQEKMCIFAV